jgi:hypothetical protein
MTAATAANLRGTPGLASFDATVGPFLEIECAPDAALELPFRAQGFTGC